MEYDKHIPTIHTKVHTNHGRIHTYHMARKYRDIGNKHTYIKIESK